jgi:hypothetical protein
VISVLVVGDEALVRAGLSGSGLAAGLVGRTARAGLAWLGEGL